MFSPHDIPPGDMIKTIKIIRQIYNEETVQKLTPSSTEYTRDHQQKNCKYVE